MFHPKLSLLGNGAACMLSLATYNVVDAASGGITSNFVCSEVGYNGMAYNIRDRTGLMFDQFKLLVEATSGININATQNTSGNVYAFNQTDVSESLIQCIPAYQTCYSWPR